MSTMEKRVIGEATFTLQRYASPQLFSFQGLGGLQVEITPEHGYFSIIRTVLLKLVKHLASSGKIFRVYKQLRLLLRVRREPALQDMSGILAAGNTSPLIEKKEPIPLKDFTCCFGSFIVADLTQ